MSTGQYTNSVNAGNNLSCTLQNLSNSTYYIAAADYDANNNESSLSTQLIVQPLAASARTGGSITPSGTFFVAQGANQTFNIAPNANYYIVDVQVDGQSVGPVSSYTLTSVSGPHSITAAFAASVTSTYTITPTAGANGTISPSRPVSVAAGGSQKFSFTPATGYKVSSVLVDGTAVATASSYTFSSVSANHTISVSFAPITYTITPTAGANGTISPSSAVTVNYGGSQKFSFTPATGYQVSSVLVDGTAVTTASSYTFSSVSANHTISVSFAAVTTSTAPTTYTISATVQGSGSISPSGTVKVVSGTNQTFTITPAANYRISGVNVDGKSIGAVSTTPFPMSPPTIPSRPLLRPITTYTISATVQGSGSISPSGTVKVVSGTNQDVHDNPGRQLPDLGSQGRREINWRGLQLHVFTM